MKNSVDEAKTPLANDSSPKDIQLDAARPFVSDCAHCRQPFNSKGPAASLCPKCFVTGHRGFTCDKYCKVSPDPLARIAISDEAICKHCGTHIGQSGTPRWWHLRNGLESCGFWAEPLSQPTASAAAQTQDVTDKGSVQHEFQYANVSNGLCWCGKAWNNVVHTSESESSISSTLAEIREQRRLVEFVGTSHDELHAMYCNHLDALLSIIDGLKADNKLLQNEVLLTKAGRDLARRRAYEVQQSAASNMKAEIVKRVREIVRGGFPEDAHVYTDQVLAEIEKLEAIQPNDLSGR